MLASSSGLRIEPSSSSSTPPGMHAPPGFPAFLHSVHPPPPHFPVGASGSAAALFYNDDDIEDDEDDEDEDEDDDEEDHLVMNADSTGDPEIKVD